MKEAVRMGDIRRAGSPRQWAVVRELLRRIEERGPVSSRWDLWACLQVEMADDRRFGEMVHFDREAYARRVLGEAEGVELVVVGWLPGQATPIHHHEGSLCAFKVLRGQLTEEQFDEVGGPRRGLRELAPGWVQACGADDVHRLANLAEAPAASLHLYTPPLRLEAA